MYIIVSDKIFDGKLAYLIWQPNCYDGWTWTFKEYVDVHEPYNMHETRYSFANREDAWRKIEQLNLRTGYVIKWDGP